LPRKKEKKGKRREKRGEEEEGEKKRKKEERNETGTARASRTEVAFCPHSFRKSSELFGKEKERGEKGEKEGGERGEGKRNSTAVKPCAIF